MLRFENHILTKVANLAAVVVFALSQPNSATAAPSTDLLKKAQILLEQHKTDAALACLSTLIKKQPRNALAYANRAGVYVGTKRYHDALNDSTKAILLQPRLALAYAMRGLAYDGLDSYRREIEECNKAIALDSKDYRYYLYRATAYRNLEQYQNAINDCNKALSLTSKAEPYIERGRAYGGQNKYEKAVSDYTTAIKIAPQASTYLRRAHMYQHLGQYQKQILDLTAAAKINPKSAEAYEQRGSVYYRLGQLQNAIADCGTAMKLDPNSEAACLTAADAYEELGLYEKALEVRTKALELDMKDAYSWNARAKVYERLGKHDLAKSDWRKTNELASASERLSMQGCSPLIDFSKLSAVDKRPQESIGCQIKSRPVVLPFHYDEGGHLHVLAQVNGHPLQLMLDTGCGHSDLWKKALPGVAEMDKTLLRATNASGKGFNYGSFRARDLKLGDLTLSNVAMGVDDGLVGHRTINGFLGGNILENFVVTVDYRKKQVVLAGSVEQNRSKSAIIVPIWIQEHQPHCRVRLDEKIEVAALLDTGCPFSMSADSLVNPILAKKLDYKDHIYGPWLGELSSESVRLKIVSLGGANFEAPIVDVYPAAEAPNAADEIVLGNDFLSRFKTVTFDYPARRVIFEPSETGSESAQSLRREGRFYLTRKEDRKAIEPFTKAMALDSELAGYCTFNRAVAFANLKQFQQAFADCNALIKREPKAPTSYALRAWVYAKSGQYDLAEKDRQMEEKLHGH
jgi:tetratricopeptide (TPR) repeat protein